MFAYEYLAVDWVEAPHGRAPAVATGIRRVRPDAFVLTYQGDGDLAAIGTAEIIHAAARGELITGIFVNNGIYGMTGGQMAPTTLLGQKTTSSPAGRGRAWPDSRSRSPRCWPCCRAWPMQLAAPWPTPPLSADEGHDPAGLQAQLNGEGFALVEVLSNCPVGWNMTAPESMAHLEEVAKSTRWGSSSTAPAAWSCCHTRLKAKEG